MPQPATTTENGIWTYRAGFILVLMAAIILPRLAASGDFIYMDEGYHAFMSAYIHQSYAEGNGFPSEMTGYKLYPYLLFWLWDLPGNTVMWIRLCDMAVATGMGYVFCKMLIRESGSRLAGLLLGFAFLAGINYAGAINSGFKNSFFPAFLFLCLAVNTARNAGPRSWRWFMAGAFTGMAILFRETFVLFPIIGAVSLLLTRNYQGLWRYVAGGIVAAAAVTLISALLRGQIWGIFDFYFTYGRIYGPEAGKRITKFVENGGRAIVIYSPLLLISLLSIATVGRKHGWRHARRACFWLACALAPIVEPYLKIGFLYHFSACLPGLAGLCAFCHAHMDRSKLSERIYTWGLIICAAAMLPYTFVHYQKLPITWETLKHFPARGWPDTLANMSTTLEAARIINQILPPGGKVSSSGFAYFIFPASGAFPPAIGVGDLSRTFIYADEDTDKFNAAVARHKPDIVLLAKTGEDHSATFHKQLKEIFDHNPDYSFHASIEADASKNYGWLGYDIYRRSPKP